LRPTYSDSDLAYRCLCIPARRPTRTVAGSRRALSGACSAADIKLARPARARLPAGIVRRQLAVRARLDQRLHGRRISAGSLPVSWHSPHSIPFRSRRAAARMMAWTRRPQRSILIRSPAALCSQCHGAQGAALRVRCECGARDDTCAWRLSSCADCVNLSVFVSCCGALRGAQCRRATQSFGNRIPPDSCLCYVNAVPSRPDAK
jgi:hypothetical protein